LGYLQNPKHWKGISFSPNGLFLSVVERENGKDSVTIIRLDTWEAICNFQLSTVDASDLKWSPNSMFLCVSDSVLEYKVQIYSLNGTLIKEISQKEESLGIKKIAWEPNGRYVAIGSYDSKIRLLKYKSWKIIAEFSHNAKVNQDCIIFQEEFRNSQFQCKRFLNHFNDIR
jgi:WD40 repeat protein